ARAWASPGRAWRSIRTAPPMVLLCSAAPGRAGRPRPAARPEVPAGADEGTHWSMGADEPADRVRCWQRWQAGRDASAAARRPPSSIAKDFLGAAVTLAI